VGKASKSRQQIPYLKRASQPLCEGISGMAIPVYPSDVNDDEWAALSALNPIACSRGELYDAYQVQIARTSQIYDEILQLYLRQSALEKFIATLVEHTLEGRRCRLGECEPRWDQTRGRYAHVEPCSLAAGEELLRRHVTTRTHYGLDAEKERPRGGREVFALGEE